VTHKANTLEELYQAHLNTWSDMQHHMGVLRYFAGQCDTVLELGMRMGVSTTAFLSGGPVVTSVDVMEWSEPIKQLRWLSDRFQFEKASSLEFSHPADLIFFDTKHTYLHLKTELHLHAHNAGRYMIFHDTQTFRHSGEDGSEPGLLAAIEPYLGGPSPTWKKILDLDNCCGLMVLERNG
jgi:hypothetical protein